MIKMFLRNVCKKRIACLVVAATMIMGLGGCGKHNKEIKPANGVTIIGDISENTVKLSPNGIVTEISCQDYTDAGTDLKGLKDYIDKQIEDYNDSKGSTKITLVEYIEDDKSAKVALQYTDFDAYADFNKIDTELIPYDPQRVVDMVAEEMKAEVKQPVIDTANVNLEELAEAGYDIEDLENGVLGGEVSEASATDAATLTDAIGNNIVKAEEIDPTNCMMLITSENINYSINSGRVLYYNSKAVYVNENTVLSTGQGKSVIVFTFN